MKRSLFLICGLLCLGVGSFLTYGLQYVTENYSWYLGYMVVAFVVGLWSISIFIRKLRKSKKEGR